MSIQKGKGNSSDVKLSSSFLKELRSFLAVTRVPSKAFLSMGI